jgi:ubiquinone/menaquinone biosynthesis C-methylase UbiE
MTGEELSVMETDCPGCRSAGISPRLGASFLAECASCGLIFDNPRPSRTAIAAFYSSDGKYDGWLVNLQGREAMWARRLQKMRRHKSPGNLLDVGAGIGQFLSMAAGEYSGVFGTEVSGSAVKIAQSRYGITLHRGDLCELALPSSSFDNITLFHVLEHVHEPLRLIEESYRLLRKGGTLFVAVPNDIDSIKHRLHLANLKPIELKTSGEVHLSHFTSGSLARLIARSGLSVLQTGLDPQWADHTYYWLPIYKCLGAWYSLSKTNFYSTIWLAARKAA